MRFTLQYTMFIKRSKLMRFFENGPSIPDELLLARDEGRVVFFCGAGVSVTEGLPNFDQLAKDVFEKLGVTSDSPAFRLFTASQKIFDESGGIGSISADRVFGLLEEEFPSDAIETAVAQSLKPKTVSNLRAHNILLDLATTDMGYTQLITTNFDCLFEECGRNLPVHQPPKLPDPARPNDMHGIIHLHGKSTSDYQKSEQQSFVLTSSEFGRAYLAEGWATSFIKKIIKNYIVVFIGYTADDPPVQYLLEALKKNRDLSDKIFAFQSGDKNNAKQKWKAKGVTAISYNDSDEEQHEALWETLEAWSIRAKDYAKWYDDVIQMAQTGPRELKAYQRGQVTHIISTSEGVRKFAEAEPPLSSEWLYVFDANQRYAAPKRTKSMYEEGGTIENPFELYHLDIDEIPEEDETKSTYSFRQAPYGAWDAFAFNSRDLKTLNENNYPSLKGQWSTIVPELPSRLRAMRNWIGKIADQPATVCWAASLGGLHPAIQQEIQSELRRDDNVPKGIKQAWSYLFETWERKKIDFHADWYNLEDDIQSIGWSNSVVRRYAAILRPYVKTKENTWEGSPFRKQTENISCKDVIVLEVEYPSIPSQLKIPKNWILPVVIELRRNLEFAFNLEIETDTYNLSDICSITPDDETNDDDFRRENNLSGAIIHFSTLFNKLVNINENSATKELSFWKIEDNSIFSLLGIWAAGKEAVVPNYQFRKFISKISDEDFWSATNTRDLLLILKKRWNKLNLKTRQYLEQRLLAGPIIQYAYEEDAKFIVRQAWNSLNRLNWLAEHKCELTIDLLSETQTLQRSAPEWKLEYTEFAAESRHGTASWKRNKSTKIDLKLLPLGDIILSATKYMEENIDNWNDYSPFSQLSEKHGLKALAALRLSSSNGNFQQWAWNTFLYSSLRRNDSSRLAALIAERLERLPRDTLVIILEPTTYWFESMSKILAKSYPNSFNKLMKKLVRVMGDEKTSTYSENTKSVLSPSKLIEALFNYPVDLDDNEKKTFPKSWISHANELLALPDKMKFISIEYFTRQLNWCFHVDHSWTQNNLLSILKNNDENKRVSFWQGFRHSRMPSIELYMLMKSDLLSHAKTLENYGDSYGKRFSDFVYAGWISKIPDTDNFLISNIEMRTFLLGTSEKIRLRILWKIGRQSKPENGSEKQENTLRLIKFLQYVWPKQTAVKSANISAGLVNLAFSDINCFLELSKIIQPLITKYDDVHLSIPNLTLLKTEIVTKYPFQSLELIYTILPDNVGMWPRNIKDVFDKIINADPNLTKNNRYKLLMKKWSERL